ncbi:hypothetical protein FOZ62_008075 [Perkinsus olseni]|uniref:Uncharacterized protein n=1 Tax=Perkinsus olseni TaxID=32597 RepID=A0A7J6QYS9_PEROL|nr:hypothetical protein FOZ62_008075 [Perkinsus olseni]
MFFSPELFTCEVEIWDFGLSFMTDVCSSSMILWEKMYRMTPQAHLSTLQVTVGIVPEVLLPTICWIVT